MFKHLCHPHHPTPDAFNCSPLIKQARLTAKESWQGFLEAVDKGVITDDHQCLLKMVSQVDDIGALLNEVAENTVVLIVQDADSTDDPVFSITFELGEKPAATGSGNYPAYTSYTRDHRSAISFIPPAYRRNRAARDNFLQTYLSGSLRVTQLPASAKCLPSKTAAHLKKGTVLIGINETPGGSIPLCEAEQPERIWLMFEVGHNDQFEDVGKLYISGFNFYSLLDNNPDPVDSVWRVRCYTGDVYFENNYFRLDTRASVYLQCTHNTEQRVQFGFRGNTVVGMGSAQSRKDCWLTFATSTTIPRWRISVITGFPAISSQPLKSG